MDRADVQKRGGKRRTEAGREARQGKAGATGVSGTEHATRAAETPSLCLASCLPPGLAPTTRSRNSSRFVCH